MFIKQPFVIISTCFILFLNLSMKKFMKREMKIDYI